MNSTDHGAGGIGLEQVRRALATHRVEPEQPEKNGKRASVALILAEDPADPLLCLIRRADHEDDPWSGHMALPGGRMDATDGSPRMAAERETWEEIGLRLGEHDFIAPLSERAVFARGRDMELVLHSFVFALPGPTPELRLNQEVAEVFWLPLSQLVDPAQRDEIEYRRDELDLRFPSIRCGPHHVWGLTYRILADFFYLLGHELPRDPFEKRRG